MAKIPTSDVDDAEQETAPVVAPPKPAIGDAGAVADEVVDAAGEFAAPPWAGLKVVVIDDAMHPPRIDRLPEGQRDAVADLLQNDGEIAAELHDWGVPADAGANDRLHAIAEHGKLTLSFAKIGTASADAQRMIEEHFSFREFCALLENEIPEVTVCDPFEALPDLSGHNLVLLDYYLEGSINGGDRAIGIARAIWAQGGRAADQQIVLMSSLETVRQLRTQFREQTDIEGSAFAFIAKSDLDERWKVKAHLAMLDRARPYAPKLTEYRAALGPALDKAKTDLLSIVDDLDIGDYAFLQSHALMKDGHPLGDYVFWLLSSQLMSLAFEGEEMRERQRELDKLEFVGEPFAATEPSIVVANLFHSALVSRNIGPLAPHPRAQPGSDYEKFPLVQLGDVFLDAERTRAVAVLSADCDLAFSPTKERAPDPETPVMMVPGNPIRMQDEEEKLSQATAGILVSNEVYQVEWKFAQYRSVELGKLQTWLKEKGFETGNRDRLRPLFGLKLQQEFGAHLLRVGPPLMPPITTPAAARVYICTPDRDEFEKLDSGEVMVSRFKGTALVRITPKLAGVLKRACEELAVRLGDALGALAGQAKVNAEKKLAAVQAKLADDDFWIGILGGLELGTLGSPRIHYPVAVARGAQWSVGKPHVVLEIVEDEPDKTPTAMPEEEAAEPREDLAGDVTGA